MNGHKLQSLSCPEGKAQRTEAPKNGRVTISPPMLLRGDNRVPLLIIHNLHVKFESDRSKTVVCIMPTRFYTQSANVDL